MPLPATKTNNNSLYGFEMRDVDNRRAPEGERKTYDIKQLWQRNHEILRLALYIPKHKEIARLLGITEATVSNTLNSELGRKKLALLREKRDGETVDVMKEVALLLPKALETYENILNGENVSKLQKETADTLTMDIGGYRAPTKTHVQGAHLHLTAKEIEDFVERGKNAAKSAGLIVEAEFETVEEKEITE
jgi:predicted transcriptional regulator